MLGEFGLLDGRELSNRAVLAVGIGERAFPTGGGTIDQHPPKPADEPKDTRLPLAGSSSCLDRP
jgi:hypothetical protein